MTAQHSARPPRLHAAFLRWVLPSGIRRESIIGDLCEEFSARADSKSVDEARRWYRRQSLRVVADHLFRRRLRENKHRHSTSPAPKSRPGDPFMSTLLRDLRYAVRSFRRTPGFTAVAILTIALGVGANAAIFSVVNGVVLRPLPYTDSERIVRPWVEKIFSRAMFLDFREYTTSFSHSALHQGPGFILSGGDVPQMVTGGAVTAEYFDILGAAPYMGRTFRLEDQLPGGEPVVLLTYGLWQSRFGGDPNIVGRRIDILGQGVATRTVIGVMPQTHARLNSSWQLWVPMNMDPDDPAANFRRYGYRFIARLAPGVSLEQSRAELTTLVPTFTENHPTQFRPARRSPIPVLTHHEATVGNIRATLLLLLGAVGLVLVIACTNVANLLLARSGAREKEVAIRLALGADRRRIIRQLLTESTLLGLAGGTAGVIAAVATLGVLVSSLPRQVPRTGDIGIDIVVLTFAGGISLLAGLLFGMAPAMRSTRQGPGASLIDTARGTSFGRASHRLNNALVVVEVALAMVLIIGAGLVLKSFTILKRVDVGFSAASLVSLRPVPQSTQYSGDRRVQYYESVLERVRAIPGVEGVTTIDWLPMTRGGSTTAYLAEGQDVPQGPVSQIIGLRAVNVDHFEAMGIPLVRGRRFEAADHEDAPAVGIANETLVQMHWPDEDPIGKRLLRPSGDPWVTIVGVAQSIRQHQLDLEPRPQIYIPVSQAGYGSPYIVVRTSRDPKDALPTVRDAVQSIDRTVAIIQVATLDDVIDASLGNTKFLTTLFSGFAGLALLLGAVGVYGVMSYVTSQRTKEIGLRVALGAAPAELIRNTLVRGFMPVLTGIAIGAAIALSMTKLMTGYLFEVRATDPTIFVGVAAILALTGIAACYLPALRASRVDPMEVLKEG